MAKYLDESGVRTLWSKVKTLVNNNSYPIGAIYMSVNNTSPASLFGGNWQKIEGKYLFSADNSHTTNTTFGSQTHNHSLNSAYALIHLADGFLYNVHKNINLYLPTNQIDYSHPFSSPGKWNVQTATKLSGTTDNGSNMPPSFVVNVWKRIA